jgi:hypothetical protein
MALLAATALVVLAAHWGRHLIDGGVPLFVGAPPFAGSWDPQWPVGLWTAVVVAVGLVVVWVPATERLRWGAVLAGSAACSAAWSVALAASAGWAGLAAPLVSRFEYLPLARRIDDPGAFLRSFVDRLPQYPTHVKGHPPGAVLAFWGLDRIGLTETGVALLVLAVAASAAPAALVALDRVSGRATARRAAAFVGLAPAVVWVATSTDALFMGVAAWAVAVGAVAVTAERPRVATGAGIGAGLLAGALLTMTYGAATLLGPLWALLVWAAWRRRWAPVLAAAVGTVVLPGALALAGFDWAAGLEATRGAYRAGVARDRPYRYFLVANLAALTVALGPATVAGLAWLRDRTAWLLVGGALAGAVAADLSGLSKGEVERIWLPLVPFLVLATCALAGRNARRGWLAAQLTVAVVLQVGLRTPW